TARGVGRPQLTPPRPLPRRETPMDLDATSGISRPPTGGERFFDRSFRWATFAFAWLAILSIVFLFTEIGRTAAPAVRDYGTRVFVGTEWAAGREHFGLLPAIWGTVYSSVVGVALGGAFGVAVAIFLTEDFLPPRWNLVLKNVIELLAAVPSVV